MRRLRINDPAHLVARRAPTRLNMPVPCEKVFIPRCCSDLTVVGGACSLLILMSAGVLLLLRRLRQFQSKQTPLFDPDGAATIQIRSVRGTITFLYVPRFLSACQLPHLTPPLLFTVWKISSRSSCIKTCEDCSPSRGCARVGPWWHGHSPRLR